jgi:hypothetical protein
MEMAPPERGLSFLFGSDGFGEVHKAVDMGPIGKESDEIVIVVDAVDEGALHAKGCRLRFARGYEVKPSCRRTRGTRAKASSFRPTWRVLNHR